MHKLASLWIAMLLSSNSLFAQQEQIMGFTNESSEEQYKLEAKFDSYLKSQNLDVWMERLAARPHHVGSAYGKENAEFMVAKFKEWGFDAELAEYQVLFPTPKVRILEMTSPTKFKARLEEPALKEDATSGQKKEQLPTYNSFSANGDVTAELVFVNYGIPSDYEELEKLGIDVEGKIVIAKYGGSWRGIKPKLAAEKGAIGCIIYSDPKDDGFYRGDVYPEGPFKNKHGVQRGSVLDMPLYPGDPLTPGYAATENAERLDRSEAPTLMKIPVLPISYSDAQPFLAALEGPVAPEDWKGALPITYHVGPGPATVHLKLEFDWQLQPAYNVIAKMEGSAYPDEWIIRGNHHDAWVNGANDPISGMVAVMEEARAVGELVKMGWKPKRTLIYCGWDAEEPGLLGSTEWVEDHLRELKEKAVAYINSDSNGRGFLYAGGSHTLEKFFGQIARDVDDPQTDLTVAERRNARLMTQGEDESNGIKLSALGSGSDYTPFIQHAGIASLNIGFGGENAGGEYHSIYDSYDHYTRFKDPDFIYGIALIKVAGRTSLRLANAEVLPFDFTHFYNTVEGYAEEVMKLADDIREQTDQENEMAEEGIYAAAADPQKPFVAPEPKEEVPHFNFAPLMNELEQLEKLSMELKNINPADVDDDELKKLNTLLYTSERALTIEEGLPGRNWFRHQIYAPGFYTGYGVKTLPQVREAIEQRKWETVDAQIEVLAEVLEGFNQQLIEIKALIE
ncbi:N-acetylated-alpha-linked acidic dipeptidase [Catalinimonas alkaloidigena]|uniref:M28 family metallopeptidase n=1 Tax=Catalinimonas alkaloidigena TaxID=1075417 RepID=UPI0024070396|nr:M28 family metallopeptidase [Catalinimonas alkaloidigena]MDF9796985.1 N-acetylated-alpha-linked acidic dipeptidase [Catalinimonas alkaloidigena]